MMFGVGIFIAILSSAGFGISGKCSHRVRTYFTVGTSLAGIIGWPLMLIFEMVYVGIFGLDRETRTIFPSGAHEQEKFSTPSDLDTRCTLFVLALATACILMLIPLFYFRIGPYLVRMAELASKDVEQAKSPTIARRSFWKILGDVFPLAFSGWMIMFATFLVLPDQIVAWKTTRPEMYPGGDFGYQNINIYVFQVFDVISRFTCLLFDIKMSRGCIITGSCLRLALVPFFILSSLRIGFFDNDLWKILLNAAFAFTYGLFLTLGVVAGTAQVEAHEADYAGYIISFLLVNGIFCGSWVAMAVNLIPTKYWSWKAYEADCKFGGPIGLICVGDDVNGFDTVGLATTVLPTLEVPTELN
jgi:hypothetical protein